MKKNIKFLSGKNFHTGHFLGLKKAGHRSFYFSIIVEEGGPPTLLSFQLNNIF
jgi:hypothetical protein